MADSVKIKGLDEAMANLRKFGKGVEAIALPKAAKAGAQAMQRAVKPRIPKKSGNMAKTLRVAKKTGDGVGYSVRVGNRRNFQAFLLEFGFHHIGGDWVQVPFMRPAFEQDHQQVFTAFVESLGNSIDAAQLGGLV